MGRDAPADGQPKTPPCRRPGRSMCCTRNRSRRPGFPTGCRLRCERRENQKSSFPRRREASIRRFACRRISFPKSLWERTRPKLRLRFGVDAAIPRAKRSFAEMRFQTEFGNEVVAGLARVRFLGISEVLRLQLQSTRKRLRCEYVSFTRGLPARRLSNWGDFADFAAEFPVPRPPRTVVCQSPAIC